MTGREHAPSGARSPASRLALGALAVFLVGLGLRWSHLASLAESWDGTLLFSIARGDAAHHWHEALEILDRDPWLRDRVFWKGPGYSYFLAGMAELFGRSPGTLRWPLAFLGSVNCAGLVLLARRVLSPGWSVLAGLLAAVHGVLLLFDGELLFPTLLISLNLVVLLWLTHPRAGVARHGGAGFCLGVSALVHPVYLAPAALLTLWTARRDRRCAAVLALAVAAVVAPVTARNIAVHGQPLLISWNGGINVYVGNQPAFDQYSGNRTNAWSRILQSPVDAGIESEHERDRLYYRLAGRELLRAPLTASSTLLHKALILFSPVEYASNIRLYELREHSPVLGATLGRWGPLWWPFGLWAPPAIVGWWLLRRRRTVLAQALGVWGLGLALTVVVSFNTARYRAPLVFFGCICVAYALSSGWRTWRLGQRRSLAAGIGLAALLAIAIGALAEPQRGFPLPLEWDEASVRMRRGEPDAALLWVERALERQPDDPALKLASADCYRRLDLPERERTLLRAVVADRGAEPDLLSIGHQRLARSLAADGRIGEARDEMQRALDVGVDETNWRDRPYYRLGLGPLGACRLRLAWAGLELDAGEPSRAAALMERVRSDCPLHGGLASRWVELEARAVLAAPRIVPAPDDSR